MCSHSLFIISIEMCQSLKRDFPRVDNRRIIHRARAENKSTCRLSATVDRHVLFRYTRRKKRSKKNSMSTRVDPHVHVFEPLSSSSILKFTNDSNSHSIGQSLLSVFCRRCDVVLLAIRMYKYTYICVSMYVCLRIHVATNVIVSISSNECQKNKILLELSLHEDRCPTFCTIDIDKETSDKGEK
jgi:hypothetical protein